MMEKKDEEIVQEAVNESLGELFKNFPRNEDEFWLMKLMLNNPKELISTIFSNYFDVIEPGGCECDKARFVTKKLFESLEKQEVLALQYTYAESNAKYIEDKDANNMCYWCPCTFKNTKEAFDGLMSLINPKRLPKFLKQQAEVYKPYQEAIIERQKKYYLEKLSHFKPIDRDITVEEFIDENLKNYPKVSFHLQIVDSTTGIPKYFYDSLIKFSLIDNHNLRKRKIILIDDEYLWKNIESVVDDKYAFSTASVTIEGE